MHTTMFLWMFFLKVCIVGLPKSNIIEHVFYENLCRRQNNSSQRKKEAMIRLVREARSKHQAALITKEKNIRKRTWGISVLFWCFTIVRIMWTCVHSSWVHAILSLIVWVHSKIFLLNDHLLGVEDSAQSDV